MFKKYRSVVLAGAAAASIAVGAFLIYKYVQSNKKDKASKVASKVEKVAEDASKKAIEKVEEKQAQQKVPADLHVEEKIYTPKAVVQKEAPAWAKTAIINGEIKQISSQDYAGKYTVLFFYPLDFTFVCPTELTAFSDRIEDFKNLNCELIGASIDSEFVHLAWLNTPRKQGGLGTINYPLIADVSHSLAQDYGVLIEEEGIALRGLFIIDTKGIIRHISINDLPVGRNVDEVLRLVEAFQYTDKHGEVCPANWNRDNKKTMIPDPVKSKAYFESAN